MRGHTVHLDGGVHRRRKQQPIRPCLPSNRPDPIRGEHPLQRSSSAITSPSGSCESVATPNRAVASYSLSRPVRYSRRRVARPIPSTRRPVAKGSSVPAWPTLLNPRAHAEPPPRHRAKSRPPACPPAASPRAPTARSPVVLFSVGSHRRSDRSPRHPPAAPPSGSPRSAARPRSTRIPLEPQLRHSPNMQLPPQHRTQERRRAGQSAASVRDLLVLRCHAAPRTRARTTDPRSRPRRSPKAGPPPDRAPRYRIFAESSRRSCSPRRARRREDIRSAPWSWPRPPHPAPPATIRSTASWIESACAEWAARNATEMRARLRASCRPGLDHRHVHARKPVLERTDEPNASA